MPPPRTILLRGSIPCVLILAALCAFAGPKDKEPAPRFNATTTAGEKFTNDSIKGKCRPTRILDHLVRLLR
jgi:hypothetical protein